MKNRKFPSHKPSWLDDKLDQMEQMYLKERQETHLMGRREFVQRMIRDQRKRENKDDERL